MWWVRYSLENINPLKSGLISWDGLIASDNGRSNGSKTKQQNGMVGLLVRLQQIIARGYEISVLCSSRTFDYRGVDKNGWEEKLDSSVAKTL